MRINTDIISVSDPAITLAQFHQRYPSDKFIVINQDGAKKFISDSNTVIEKGEKDGLNESEFDALNKAIVEFRSMKEVPVYSQSGDIIKFYVKEKESA
jgi:hypothetical protein